MYRQNIVVFTGAGISAESGLPTFRGNNGLWRSEDCENMATASAFYERQFWISIMTGENNWLLQNQIKPIFS